MNYLPLTGLRKAAWFYIGPSMATSVTGGDDNSRLPHPHFLTLDETYKHGLLAIDGGMQQHTQRLFQCFAVSIRPLGDVLALKALLRDIPRVHLPEALGQKLIAGIGIGTKLEDKRGEPCLALFQMIENQ